MIDAADLGLRRGDLVLFDTAPLIYLIEGGATEGKFRENIPGSTREADRRSVSRFFASAARAGDLRLAASALAWTECLAGPLAEGDRGRADQFRQVLADSTFIRVEAVDVAVAEEAACLIGRSPRGGRSGLGFADCVHLATAVVIGAAAVLTNDEAWRSAVKAAAQETGPRAAAYRRLIVLLVDELCFDL